MVRLNVAPLAVAVVVSVVATGFVGNTVLKTAEGMAEGLFQTIASELESHSPQFRAEEKRYVDFLKARKFLGKH